MGLVNGAPFVKSSFCTVEKCVEARVSTDGNLVIVRDSKNPYGTQLEFTFAEWDAFITGVKANEFDLTQSPSMVN